MNVPCRRCGQCCREATVCDLHGWFADDRSPKIEGTCKHLGMNPDGTAFCEVIRSAIANDRPWHGPTRDWITGVLLTRGCELALEAAEAAGEGE
jgi:hypothetical protein